MKSFFPEMTNLFIDGKNLKKHPFQLIACEIQTCLKANDFKQEPCEYTANNLEQCCYRHLDYKWGCCSAFRKQMEQKEFEEKMRSKMAQKSKKEISEDVVK
ncbi:unnamed protein product [Owenia fusiformis]|uniref:Uncharacterized protein n=1 Tax=Owenia fusiformis TaxID=6347 RepID=A0A8J1Y1R9_OWEFU|nr:unnamed protein product [Owenia fusiformis]